MAVVVPYYCAHNVPGFSTVLIVTDVPYKDSPQDSLTKMIQPHCLSRYELQLIYDTIVVLI